MPDATAPLRRPVLGLAWALVLATMVAASCAQVDEPDAVASSGREVTYVAVKVIPAGKTLRSSKADGSIQLEEVPADVLGGEGIDDPTAIECLVAGRALPAGTVLRRSQFVDASELGLGRGMTDGTTVDTEC